MVKVAIHIGAFPRYSGTYGHAQLAVADIIIIDRVACGDDLFVALEDESQELSDLAMEVFDGKSTYKESLMSNNFLKGTGCWGSELNEGKIVHINDVNVKENARGMGVGSLALKKLFKSKYVRRGDVVTTWPAAVPNSEGQADEELVLRFFRKNGFRRIGRTHFFAYSSDPEHPSHRVAIDDDVRYLEDDIARDMDEHADSFEDAKRLRQFGMMPGFDYEAETRRKDNRHRERFPAHHIITDYFMHRGSPDSKPLLEALLELYRRDPQLLRKVDENGLTPLHIAAKLQYAGGIRVLLAIPAAATGDRKTPKRGTVYEDLKRFDNIEGMTPEDFCKAGGGQNAELEFLQMMFGIRLPRAPVASETDRKAECIGLLSEAMRVLETESQ